MNTIIRTDESLIVRTPDTSADYVCHLESVDLDGGSVRLTFATGCPHSGASWGRMSLDAADLVGHEVVERDGADVLALTFR